MKLITVLMYIVYILKWKNYKFKKEKFFKLGSILSFPINKHCFLKGSPLNFKLFAYYKILEVIFI